MKKFISYLLVVAMLICFVPAGVFAEEATALYTVAGSDTLCGSNWNPAT